MTNPNMDEPLVVWPCYEPSGLNVKLSEQDLSHVLLIGSTGSGKTTLLTSAMGQLILHRASSPSEKIGLLVLDAKAEELTLRIRESAEVGRRTDDVVLLGPNGDCALNLFGSLCALDDVERVTRMIMAGTEQFGGDNTFWWQSSAAMLNAAFALLVASRQPITFISAVEFLRRWFLSPETPRHILELVQRLNSQGGSRHPLLATALDQVHLWQQLDPRTRTNLQTCLINILRPLTSPAAARCFDSPKYFDPAEVAHSGKLCVVSVNAIAEPELAKFIFRVAKQHFFDAVQSRRRPGRLCGLIADELPLMINRDDLDTAATIRSKRGFIMAGTQSLQSLDQRIGMGAARAMIANFNTLIFMRTREAESSVLAFVAMGTRRERQKRPQEEQNWFGLTREGDRPQSVEVPVCPVGALGQLSAHQAFIAYADGRRTESPVWFAPWFEMAPAPEHPEQTITVDSYFTSPHVEALMARQGRPRLWSSEMVQAAVKLSRRRNRKAVLKKAQAFFLVQAVLVPEGLDTLPTPWLAALPRILWSTRRPGWTKLPYFIDAVSMENGVLLLHFTQEQPNLERKFTVWDRLRVMVNAGLYPNAFRPLKRLDKRKLALQFPELRANMDGPNPGVS